jgi:hypothetical protein
VQQVAAHKQMDLLDCARLFALASMAAGDAFIAVFDAKYTFNFWRPVTAIRNADQSGNPRTPRYIRGKRGIIGLVHGVLENIREHRGIHKPLYTVRFDLSEVSPCRDQDSIWVDVHEEWLSSLQPEEKN